MLDHLIVRNPSGCGHGIRSRIIFGHAIDAKGADPRDGIACLAESVLIAYQGNPLATSAGLGATATVPKD
jgi:hypothetical protein